MIRRLMVVATAVSGLLFKGAVAAQAQMLRFKPEGGFIDTGKISTTGNALTSDIWKVSGVAFVLGLLLLFPARISRKALVVSIGLMTGAVMMVFGVVAGPTLVEKIGTTLGGWFS